MKTRDAVALVRTGQWVACKQYLAGLSAEGAYESIKFLFEACPLDLDLSGVADGAQDVLGLTLLGALHFGVGKRHRGMGMASGVGDAQANRYFIHLLEAKDVLDAALSADRHNGLAAAFNMAVAIDAWEGDQKALAEARLLDAENVPLSGYVNLLQANLEKWGGSHDVMFRIARSRMRPETPMQYMLIARAHWERQLFYVAFDETPGARTLGARYFEGEPLQDLKEASRMILGHRDADPAEQRLANSWLALAMAAAGRNKLAVPHLDRIKGHDEPSAWGLFNGPAWMTKAKIRWKAMMG